ncbi:hypothetical protein Pelo_8649 [Pelomyxa schiedti]|nr:hypothetical protein Pelo_8649 [Pelomyxa schiedti]
MSTTPKRKLLFIIFNDNECTAKHALWWAQDLTSRGHVVRVIFEGPGTRLVDNPAMDADIKQALASHLVVGACKAASGAMGCGGPTAVCPGGVPPLHQKCNELGVTLLSDLRGHANVGPFVDEGFEMVTF